MDKELILRLGEQAEDPFRHLYFEKDTGNGGVDEIVVGGRFRWDRAVSNQNILDHGFSFYLALHIWRGHVCVEDKGSFWICFGYLFEDKDAGMIKLLESWDKDSVGNDVSHITFGEEHISEYAVWQINLWENLYGLKSTPGYEKRHEEGMKAVRGLFKGGKK